MFGRSDHRLEIHPSSKQAAFSPANSNSKSGFSNTDTTRITTATTTADSTPQMATTTMDSTLEVATDELFSSLVSDIKNYNGKDPLLPWLRGIRKMKNTLSPDTLKEKLPRFLQKCAQAFETDRRYRNDMRYLRVWLHLMDFVDDPRTLLRTMEANHIGTKRCQFYQAYALYYEKSKKYDEAEKMYHLGVKNLAEPIDDLQKSYEQFLQRMERKKDKRTERKQEAKALRKPLSMKNNSSGGNKGQEVNGLEGVHRGSQLETSESKGLSNDRCIENKNDKDRKFGGDDTVVVKFVDTAIVGKSEAEDACHHGLVDPTINMKEAINAINSMFREPLEAVQFARKSNRNRPKEDHGVQNGFEIFIDENSDKEMKISKSSSLQHRTEASQSHQEPFQIYIDDEGSGDLNDEKNILEQSDARSSEDSASQTNAFVFPRPKDLLSESSGDMNAEGSRSSRFREDTVVRRFVGSTISDEPQVENVCHHGLVDPTINLKEAMDDINNMFGKPIDFVRRKRSRKQEKAPESNIRKETAGFSILADDDLDHQQGHRPPKLSGKSSKSDLFEPTVLTKEAMDDISKMFSMPLDF